MPEVTRDYPRSPEAAGSEQQKSSPSPDLNDSNSRVQTTGTPAPCRYPQAGLPAHCPRTGAYAVDVAAFEALALPALSPPPPSAAARRSVVVIDEVGRMELHSAAFQAAVTRLLASPAEAVVFGALTAPIYGHRVPFCDAIAAHGRVSVDRITQKTRDAVREALQRRLKMAVARGGAEGGRVGVGRAGPGKGSAPSGL